MTGVHDVTYDLSRRHGVTTILGKRVAVPEGISGGLPLFPRLAGGPRLRKVGGEETR
jgi:hypothetical protein